MKETNIKIFGDDIEILPTNNLLESYRYSEALLKHMPKDSIKIFENTLLYSKKMVKYPANQDRRPNNNAIAVLRTNENIAEIIQKLTNMINMTKTYRVPLRYLCDIGKVNHPI